MYTLGIDTSNYATSLAVFDTAAEEVVCDRKRFLPVKPGELGLRQSDAVFHHTAALPELLRELDADYDMGYCYVLSVTPQTIGSPGRMFMLNTVLEQITRKNIWLATGEEIAGYVKSL